MAAVAKVISYLFRRRMLFLVRGEILATKGKERLENSMTCDKIILGQKLRRNKTRTLLFVLRSHKMATITLP